MNDERTTSKSSYSTEFQYPKIQRANETIDTINPDKIDCDVME